MPVRPEPTQRCWTRSGNTSFGSPLSLRSHLPRVPIYRWFGNRGVVPVLALPFLLFSVAADNPSSGQGKVNRNVLYGGGKFAILLIDLHAHNMASCHVDAGVELADIIRMAGEGKTRELEISRASVYRVLAASKGGLIPNRTRPGAGCRDITTGRATSGPVPAGAPRGSQILLPAS